MSNTLDSPTREAQGGRLTKRLNARSATAAALVIAVLAIGAFISMRRAARPVAAQTSGEEAAKAAARAMTFTQSPEPTK
jgi:hypothetical protein